MIIAQQDCSGKQKVPERGRVILQGRVLARMIMRVRDMRSLTYYNFILNHIMVKKFLIINQFHARMYIMNAYKNASYAAFVLFFIGIVLLMYGGTNLIKEVELNKNGLRAKGKVFDLNTVEPYRQAWVQFKTKEGKTVRFLDKLFWYQGFKAYSVGQEVEVIYDPSDPEKTATINQFFQRNTEPWWPVILGLVVIVAGWIMRRIMLKKARMYEDQLDGTRAIDPNVYKKSLNRTMLITFIAICVIIAIFVVVFGFLSK